MAAIDRVTRHYDIWGWDGVVWGSPHNLPGVGSAPKALVGGEMPHVAAKSRLVTGFEGFCGESGGIEGDGVR